MGSITVVGTGWTQGQLTLDAVDTMRSGARVILHTDRCGCAEWLDASGIAYETLDSLYESCEDFDEHASLAARAVMNAAEKDDVVYGVFDVRDRSVAALAAQAEVRVIAGPPAEGALLALAAGEARCLEASDWEAFHLSAREHCFIRELDSRELACEVKLRLMDVYPEESDVWLLRGGQAPESMPLYALDRAEGFDHRTCVLVPAQKDIMKLERYDFGHLMEIIHFLTGPDGCPWDRVQTHETLRPYILEEAYEVIDAIDEGSPEHLYDELGDMLLQIALHAEIGSKHGEFDISDVTTAVCEKMIHRHTHVFGRDHAGDAGEVLGIWAKNKMAERGQKTRAEAMLDVTRTLPATLRAVKVMKRAADVGMAEADAALALDRCRDSLGHAMDGEAGMGDALLALCDAARLEGVDPELALNGAVSRFIERFRSAEAQVLKAGGFDAMTPEKLRYYWDLVKL